MAKDPMHFEILHRTSYDYTAPVALGAHTIRLRPRCDGTQQLVDFRLDIHPRPQHVSDYLDHEGNHVSVVSFEGKTLKLSITSRLRIETLRENPRDYLVEPGFRTLPATYTASVGELLTGYLQQQALPAGDPLVKFTAALIERSACDPLRFLDLLNMEIHNGIEREIRETGEPLSPRATLARGRGACRDMASLFIAASRHAGFAARFVSGYQKGDQSRPRRYLHAWPEVYIPGGGWRGFDPTHGLAVADEHVPVAAASRSIDAAPIEGSYFGDAESSMQTEVSIRTS